MSDQDIIRALPATGTGVLSTGQSYDYVETLVGKDGRHHHLLRTTCPRCRRMFDIARSDWELQAVPYIRRYCCPPQDELPAVPRRRTVIRSETAQFLVEYILSLPPSVSGMPRGVLIEQAWPALPAPGPDERDTRRFRVAVALDELVKEGHHAVKDGDSVLFMK